MDNPRVPRYRIALVRETSLNVQYPERVNQPDKIALMFKKLFEELDREQLAVATLDTKLRVIGLNIVHMGALDQSIAHPREIIKLAVLQNASAIVIAHNHPSGSAAPSAEDRSMNNRMEAVTSAMGIRYLDNIIIGEDRYYSFTHQEERWYA